MLNALAHRRAFIIYLAADKSPVDVNGWPTDAQNPAAWMFPHEAEACAAMLGTGYGVGFVLRPARVPRAH